MYFLAFVNCLLNISNRALLKNNLITVNCQQNLWLDF